MTWRIFHSMAATSRSPLAIENDLKESPGHISGFDRPTNSRFYIFRSDAFLFLEGGKVQRATGRLVQNKELAEAPDHCTMVPDFDIGDICEKHDEDYARGGTSDDRKRADRKFRDRIRRRGRPILAEIYYIGVRTFGSNFFKYSETDSLEHSDSFDNLRVIFTGDIIFGYSDNIA